MQINLFEYAYSEIAKVVDLSGWNMRCHKVHVHIEKGVVDTITVDFTRLDLDNFNTTKDGRFSISRVEPQFEGDIPAWTSEMLLREDDNVVDGWVDYTSQSDAIISILIRGILPIIT